MNNILTAKLNEIAEVCRKYQVMELSIFGSQSRGDYTEQSDVDLLVEFDPAAEIGFLTLARLQNELEDIIQRKVDLVPKSGLKSVIKQSVLAEAELLYAT